MPRTNRNKPNIAILEKDLKSFVRVLNRRYGKYFREKYKFKGCLFLKTNDYFRMEKQDADFFILMKYVHLNSVKHKVYNSIEEDLFNSFIFYLATFLQNSEIQNLPNIKKITQSLDFLEMFDVIDFDYVINRYGKNVWTGFKKFLQVHVGQTINHNPNIEETFEKFGTTEIMMKSENLIIKKSKPHSITRYVESISDKDINQKNLEKYILEFSALFPWHESVTLAESYKRILLEHPSTFQRFIKSVSGKVSIYLIAKTTKVNRYTIEKQL